MKIINCKTEAEYANAAADIVQSRIAGKSRFILGLPTGSTPIPVYAELVRRYKAGEIDFANVTTYNLDEYVGLPLEHYESYYSFMHRNLFDHVNLEGRTNLPDGLAADPDAAAADYEARIQAAGGIDLQLLGMGFNGHIGFNEPGTPFESPTHRIQLTDSTIDANKRFFASRDEVPREALSMGMKTIMNAREILMLVNTPAKAEVLNQALTGPVTVNNPASVLQLHPFVTVITCF